jgi:hypothetical protein
MKKNIIFHIFIVSFIFSSCVKKEIENKPIGNSPVFKAEGTFNNESFTYEAGEDNMFMSSFTETINGVNKYSGKLSDGSTEIELGIFDGNLDSPNNSFIENGINSINWATNLNLPIAVLSKNSFSNNNLINKIDWFSGNTFLGTDLVTIYKPGKYSICANVTFYDGTQKQLCNELILGYSTKSNFSLQFDYLPGNKLNTWINIEKGEIESVKWLLNNVEINNSNENIISTINQLDNEITAIVKFKNGVVRKKTIFIDGSFNDKNIQDFSIFEITSINNFLPKMDYSILLIMRKNNIEYRSDFNGNQNNSIEISDLSFYGTNDKGNKVYKLIAEITCNLQNMNDNTIIKTNFNTTFGIEIKQ